MEHSQLARLRELTEELSERDPFMRLIMMVMEYAKLGVIVTDTHVDEPGPRILYVNPAVVKHTGYTKEELLNTTPRIFQGEGTSRAVLDKVRQALTEVKAFEGKVINYKKDGTPYLVGWHLIPCLNHDDQPIYWLALQDYDVVPQHGQTKA